MKKNDIILLLVILAVAAAGFMVYNNQSKKSSDQVVITINGVEYKKAMLNEDTEITITGENGVNKLKIENGTAYMVDASCPDKLCIHQKEIHLNAEVIVCLPNKVLVEVISNERSSIDQIAN